MKKIFRMANAELNKIFIRPSMFILSTVLILALVFSFFMFNPQPSQKKFSYQLSSTSQIYLKFEEEHETYMAELTNAKANIDAFLSEKNDFYKTLKINSQTAKDSFDSLSVAVVEFNKNSLYPNDSDRENLKSKFENFKSNVKILRDYIFSLKNVSVNFFITNSDYDNIYRQLDNLYDIIPFATQINEYTTQNIIDRYNLIDNSYDIASINQKLNNLEKITINQQDLSNLLTNYYTPNITETAQTPKTTYEYNGKLKTLYDNVANCYYELGSTAEKDATTQLNDQIAMYYDYIQICKTLLTNNFELLRIGNKTDDQIVKYFGFSGTSIYNLNLGITTSKYFYDLNNDETPENDTFGYEYLTAFNFNSNSGTETNAYDFAFYAMQILSSLIIVFVIFFACSAITGEQNSGTLKMTAVRPFTRNKIYTGKFLACFNVALILMLVSLISSLVVGIVTFGFTSQNALIVINASQVLIVNPIVLMLIYLINIFINILFYIALAMLVSMLIKPTTISTALTVGMFVASTIISGTVQSSWIRFIPTTHLNLFKYFTTSMPGVLSFSIVPGMNLLVSLLVIIISFFALDLVSRLLFVSKSLDK